MMCLTSTSDTSSLSGSGILTFFSSSTAVVDGWACSSSSSWQGQKTPDRLKTCKGHVLTIKDSCIFSSDQPPHRPLLNHCLHCLNVEPLRTCRTEKAVRTLQGSFYWGQFSFCLFVCFVQTFISLLVPRFAQAKQPTRTYASPTPSTSDSSCSVGWTATANGRIWWSQRHRLNLWLFKQCQHGLIEFNSVVCQRLNIQLRRGVPE